jgi:glycosyltransferase involved in cell wall biosynthesis
METTTRVCIVVHHPISGDPRVRRYVDALVRAGALVDILCLREQEPATPRSGVRIFTIPLRYNRRRRGGFLLEYSLALFLFTVRMFALHLKNRYALIQVHNIPDFLILSALIPKLLGTKLILDNRDPMPEFYRSKFAGGGENRAMIRLVEAQERVSAMLANVVITANAAFRKNLASRSIPLEKIVVINNLPDPRIFHRERYASVKLDMSRPFTLIYPGTIAARYGLDVAIRALPWLLSRIPHLRLIIMGEQTEYSHELVELIEHLGVSSAVEMRAAVPLDEIPRHLAAADVGIYPALPDSHMSIATPTKVLEYAAMGLPVIASRLQVLEDLFDSQAVLFFEPGDVEAFGRCVLELAQNPRRRDELVRRADATFVRRLSWDNERGVYLGLVNSLLPPDTRALRLEPCSDS